MKNPLGGSGVPLTRSRLCSLSFPITWYSKSKAEFESENVVLLFNIRSRLHVNGLVFVVLDQRLRVKSVQGFLSLFYTDTWRLHFNFLTL